MLGLKHTQVALRPACTQGRKPGVVPSDVMPADWQKVEAHVALGLIPDHLLSLKSRGGWSRQRLLLPCPLPGLLSMPPWVPEGRVQSRAAQGLPGILLAQAFFLFFPVFAMNSSGLGWPAALGGHP